MSKNSHFAVTTVGSNWKLCVKLMISVWNSALWWAKYSRNQFSQTLESVKKYQKLKKTPGSTIGFLTYWTHKIVILGQKRQKLQFLANSHLMGGEQLEVIFRQNRWKRRFLMNSSLMGGKRSKVIFQQLFDSCEIVDSHDWSVIYLGGVPPKMTHFTCVKSEILDLSSLHFLCFYGTHWCFGTLTNAIPSFQIIV